VKVALLCPSENTDTVQQILDMYTFAGGAVSYAVTMVTKW